MTPMADTDTQAQFTELRLQAERRLSKLIEHVVPSLMPENVLALTHELQVHQIELEMQNHELRLAQGELEESRDAYRELYESMPVGYGTLDRAGRIYDLNPAATALLMGNAPSRPILNFNAFIRDHDLDRFTLFCRGVLSRQTSDAGEFEMKRADGSSFFATAQAAPVTMGKGKSELLRVTFKDITRRKEMEEMLRRQRVELEANRTELRALARSLFTAQEDERKRIARELHDDYCQRVTFLILEATMLRKACERESPTLAPRLAEMSRKLSDILRDIRALSHELLPRNLGDASLVVPIRTLVNEFSEKTGFEIKLFDQDVPGHIAPGIMTTIFRLLQESLCNVVKHANAKHVVVTLDGTAQELKLVVIDDGIGFDTGRVADGQHGMGIVGMRERVRLLGETVKIISQRGEGTTMVFSIPWQEAPRA
jgi:PAS domain S-box-containing protein